MLIGDTTLTASATELCRHFKGEHEVVDGIIHVGPYKGYYGVKNRKFVLPNAMPLPWVTSNLGQDLYSPEAEPSPNTRTVNPAEMLFRERRSQKVQSPQYVLVVPDPKLMVIRVWAVCDYHVHAPSTTMRPGIPSSKRVRDFCDPYAGEVQWKDGVKPSGTVKSSCGRVGV